MQIDPRERTANIIGTTIGGMVAFFIGGVLGTVVILTLDAYILAFVLAGGTGGLLLGLLRWKIRKVAKLTLGGVVAVPVGFFLGFGSSGAIFSIPAIHGLFASPSRRMSFRSSFPGSSAARSMGRSSMAAGLSAGLPRSAVQPPFPSG